MAHFAAMLGAGQAKVFTQHLEQRLVGMGGALREAAVDVQTHEDFFWRNRHWRELLLSFN